MNRFVNRSLQTLILAAAVTMIGVAGCQRTNETDPTVLEMDGWSVSRSEFHEIYDDRFGQGRYEVSSNEAQREYLRTLCNTELLLREARRVIPSSKSELRRRIDVESELRLSDDYVAFLKARFRPDSEAWDRAMKSFHRAAKTERIVMRYRGTADSARAALDRGESFEEVHRRFGHTKGEVSVSEGWRSPLWFPPRVARAVFLEELPIDTPSRPVGTARGVWITRVREYRGLNTSEDPRMAADIESLVYKMFLKDGLAAHADSMKERRSLTFHEENFSKLSTPLLAYWDSLQAVSPVTGRQHQWILRAPVWRIPAADRDLPIYELDGRTHTVAEAMAELDRLDMEFWPVQPALARAKVRGIALRYLGQIDAVEFGLDREREYLSVVRNFEESAYIDALHKRIEGGLDLTEAAIDSMVRSRPDGWRIPDRMRLSAVVFPADAASESQEFADVVSGSKLSEWVDHAKQVPLLVEGAEYIDTTDYLRLGESTPDPALQSLLHAASDLAEQETLGPIPFGRSGSAIVRCLSRLPEVLLEGEVARQQAIRELRIQETERITARILDAASKREHARLYPDAL